MTGHGSSTMAVAGQAFRTLSALCGIAVPFLSVLVAAGVGYLRPGYSHTEQRLSELGAAGAPHSSVFNLLGLMTSGALVVVLSAGLHAELGGNRLARIASPLLAVS
ncbi:MAG: DUF998 domain-containing protein, partial [Dehalococcoidia bacterium]|nr:DUF998 domain-containing protein [Dehalococcoidia bacterium]